jgi:hypothetical protein
LIEKGIDRLEEWLGPGGIRGSETKASLYDREDSDRLYYIDKCLKAVAKLYLFRSSFGESFQLLCGRALFRLKNTLFNFLQESMVSIFG